MEESRRPDDVAGRLAGLAGIQDDVVSRRQALAAGVERWHVRARLRSGLWQAYGRQAIVLHNGPLTRRQLLWCAVFTTGPHAVLDGLTALEVAGMEGFATQRPQVVVPKSSRPWRASWVDVRESRRHLADDVHPHRRPPAVRSEVAVINAALRASTLRYACAIVAAAVQQRLVRAEDLWPVLHRVRRHRYRRALIAVVADVEGGAQSLLELDFARVARRHGLPEPSRQAPRRDGEGRRRYLDVHYDDFGVTVEIDGRHHTGVIQWMNDAVRQADLAADGQLVLQLPGVLLRADEVTAMRCVRRVLESRGWRAAA